MIPALIAAAAGAVLLFGWCAARVSALADVRVGEHPNHKDSQQ